MVERKVKYHTFNYQNPPQLNKEQNNTDKNKFYMRIR